MPHSGQRPTPSGPNVVDNQRISTSNQTLNAFIGGNRPSWMQTVQSGGTIASAGHVAQVVGQNDILRSSQKRKQEKRLASKTTASKPPTSITPASSMLPMSEQPPPPAAPNMSATRPIPNCLPVPTISSRATDSQAQHSEDSVLPSPALTNEPSPADTTRNASPNVVTGVLPSATQDNLRGKDVVVTAEHGLGLSDSPAQSLPRTSAPHDSDAREAALASKRIMARLAADAEAKSLKRARRGSGAEASQPIADGQYLDQWMQKINARVELSGGWHSIGNDLDTLRYQYLKQACQVGDTFYMILHQLLCLWSARQQTARDALPNVPPATVNRAMELLQMILRPNHTLSPQHLKWFGIFPLSTFEHISHIRDQIGQFLEAFMHQWQALLNRVKQRQTPLTAWELVHVLRCGSKTLQGTLFTVSRRTLEVSDDAAVALNGLFGEDQHNEQMISTMNQSEAEANASRHRFMASYQALVAQARQPRSQFPVVPTQSHLLQSPTTYNAEQLHMQPAPQLQGYQPNQPNQPRLSFRASSGQQGQSLLQGTPNLVVSTSGGASVGYQHRAVSSYTPVQFATRDRASLGFPSMSVPRSGPPGQAQSSHMWNQEARTHNNKDVPHRAGGAMSPGGEMVATIVRQLPSQHQIHHGIQQPFPASAYSLPASSQPSRYPGQQIYQNSGFTHPHAQIHLHGQPNAGSLGLSVAVPDRLSTRTPTPVRQATPQRRPQQILPHEYPRSPYDWKSIETGAHLPQLRSPQRQPLEAMLPTSRHYQYFSSFVVRPTHLPPEMGVRRLEFSLSAEDIQKTSKRVSEPTGLPISHYFDGSHRYRLRLCARPEDETEVKDFTWAVSPTHWPPDFYPSINNQPLLVPRKQHFHHDLPIDVSDDVIEGKNVISLSFPKTPSNFEKQKTYFVAVELVVTSRYETILDMVQRSGQVPFAETVDKIARRLNPSIPSDSDDVIVEDETLSISVADPFTSVLFDVPVRGINCKHMECFDLSVWLMTREGKPSALKGQEPSLVDNWNCPICGQDARPNMLQIDDYMVQVRSKLLGMGKENTKAIQVAADGSWQPVMEPEEPADDGEEDEGHSGAGTAYKPPALADIVEILDD